MRRHAVGICAFVMIVGGAHVAAAQAPADAPAVLRHVQQFYGTAHQLTALFRQTVTNATFQTSETSDGRLWVRKPSEFRWDYVARRHGRVVLTRSFVFDGTTLWLVDHDNKQIAQSQVQASALPAAVSFLTGGSALSSQFTVALDTSGTLGRKGTIVLELTPHQPSARYRQLFFVVDPSDWHVTESRVVDSSGNTNDVRFYAPNLATTVSPSFFRVNPSALPTYKHEQPPYRAHAHSAAR